MRITDNILTNTFLTGLSSNKTQMQKLQTQLAAQSKITKPSDSPMGTARSLRLSTQLSDNQVYSDNIANAQSGLDFTSQALDSMMSEMDKIMTTFTNINNPVNTAQYATYADYIDNSLSSMLNSANTEHDGKYIFGGTDYSSKPFDFSSDKKSVKVEVNDISGEQFVKTAPNITQKINISGAELFATNVQASGNVDSGNAGGQTSATKVYDARGNEYNFNVTYTKTADNTYDMKYSITDSGGAAIYNDSKSVKFNPNNGGIQSINGENPDPISINVPGKEIYFTYDIADMTEKAGSSSFSYSANQKTDIFNTLIRIRDNLKNGVKPSDADYQAVKDFNNRLSQKTSETGNMINLMDSTDELLSNQNTQLTALLSKEKDVDVAKAIMDLQNRDYLLQMSYKVSSMILPKSLVDYL
jgi:flagellar hook-associated protein 3 FlgL